jgi:prepilin-type N-terminal cleavage/methylation domain-containing protein
MKALKNMGFGPRKSKSGFTLIELLIVMVILAILAGVVVMAVGGVFGSAKSAAYNSVHDEIQNAVTAYSADTSHPGVLPANTSDSITITGCSGCLVINMSALTTTMGGMLRKAPDGLLDTTLDNCTGGATGCKTTSHYIWGVDIYGSIFSSCTNTSTGDCSVVGAGSNGFQGVWP